MFNELQKQLKKLECNDHVNLEIRFGTAANGTVMYKKQCVRCGWLDKDWIPHGKIEDRHDIKPIDDELRNVYNQSKRELEVAIKEKIREKEKVFFDAEYGEYLQSPGWQAKRIPVLKRCCHVCEGCGMSNATEVHHLTYQNVGNEFLFELVGLCKDCHLRYHEKK